MAKNLQEVVKTYMEEQGLSQAKIAGLIGIGESTLSRWLGGNYPRPEAVDEKVQLFLEKERLRAESARLGGVDFVMTSVSEQVWGVLAYTRLQKSLGIVYGDAGVGKTKTAREWSKGKSDVVYVTVTPAFATPKPFLKLLARALRTSKSGTMDDVYLEILDKLEGRDLTLIIDEAQHLTIAALEIVRGITDQAQTAIVLIGNELVYHKMLGKQQAQFAQLFSRIGMRCHLRTEMIGAGDVEALFGAADELGQAYLHEICRSRFGLRGAVNVWINSQNNGNTRSDGLKAMAKQMGILV